MTTMPDVAGASMFERAALERSGFAGWVSLDRKYLMPLCPDAPGVYVLTHDGGAPVSFAEKSRGGWFKGRNPTVPIAALFANWVGGAEVIYIGMASRLRRRLCQYADFGSGKAVGHWGGRLVWQLSDVAAIKVAWMETPSEDPRTVECRLIDQFRERFGKPPFANDPHRLGR